MKRCILISPYSGDVVRNLAYLNDCILHCLSLGYSPYPSHAIFPPVLDDKDPAQRRRGMKAGRAWFPCAGRAFLFTDHGISKGMRKDLMAAINAGLSIKTIELYTTAE